MRKKTLISITGSIFLSTGVVVALFLSSFDFSKQRNEFLRHFLPHARFAKDTIDVKYPTYYIAGGTNDHIYLGNHRAPLHVLDINSTTGDTSFIQIKLKDIDSIRYWSFRLRIDSPYFFLGDGTIPVIFRGRIGETNKWEAQRDIYDSAYFVEYVPMGASSFAIRTLSGVTQEHELGKETAADTPHVVFKHDLLQTQIDGIFCIDGRLNYDKELGRVVYTHFYKNEIIVTDSALNLLYRGKTIDTISRVQIKVDTIKSSDTRTRSAPPVIVNGLSSASGGYLFVNSNLLSKNESEEAFEKSSVIDVYDLQDGAYKLSFYLYKFNDKKMKEFKVIGDKLIALYEHHVIIYDLRKAYFQNRNI